MAETFGAWLQKRMDDASIDPAELARQIKRTPSTVYQWLANETRPSDENVTRLARVLRLDKGVIHQALNRLKLLDVTDPETRDVLAVYSALSPRDRHLAAQLLRALQEHQETYKTSADEQE